MLSEREIKATKDVSALAAEVRRLKRMVDYLTCRMGNGVLTCPGDEYLFYKPLCDKCPRTDQTYQRCWREAAESAIRGE